MKVLRRTIDPHTHGGTLVLLPETPDDMWIIYNAIQIGDAIGASSTRKIVKEGVSGGSERVHVNLKLRISSDSTYDADTGSIRVTGRNLTENPFVKMHAYHSLTLDAHSRVEIEKENWPGPVLDRIVEAGEGKAADVAALVMDAGMAHGARAPLPTIRRRHGLDVAWISDSSSFADVQLVFIGNNTTVMKAKIETTVAKKRTGASAHETSVNRFFESVLEALQRHVDWSVLRVLIIASPGFVKDDFYDFLNTEANRRDDLRPFKSNMSKIVRAHASSGFKHALRGVFADPAVVERVAGTKIAGEVAALDDFFKLLNTDPLRAVYGFRHVRVAADRSTIEILMISDTLFRARDAEARTLYAALVEDVKKSGGQVQIFSSMHVSGEQLAQIGGLAAKLWYPVTDIDDAAAAYHGPVPKAHAGAAAGAAGEPGRAGDDESAPAGHATYDFEDSDASSDSDASYKRGV